MYVENLEIRKPEYGDSEDERKLPFKATVCMKGTMGEVKVKLTSAAISKIFAIIADEVVDTAKTNAKAVNTGMNEAVHSPLVLASTHIGELE